MRCYCGIVTLVLVLLSPAVGFGHGGKTDDAGCHVDSRTGKAHCHKGIAELRKKLADRKEAAESGELELDPKASVKRVTGTVTRVIDGDTIEVRVEGEKWTVRVVGIDCPESGDVKDGARATAKMKEMVDGAEVALVSTGKDFTKDRYQRVLAYVERDSSDVGLQLMRGGFCSDYSAKYPHPRQGWYKHRLRGLPTKDAD